jgi:methionyl-tRNA formyltransferase
MKLVFAGTPAFAVPSLVALLDAGHDILAVYTQPDRPAGRGRKLTPSPIKQCATSHGLICHQPAKLDQALAQIKQLHPDLMVVIAYGQILSASVLVIPRHGCVNVHASLLPRWRGAAPIARAIEAGDREIGVSLMQMDVGLDTGPVWTQASTPIHDNDTAQTLHDRLAELGAQTLRTALPQIARGETRPQPQDDSHACVARKLAKAEAPLDWTQEAYVLHCKIRALNPWPVATTRFHDRILRLWEVGPMPEAATSDKPPGTVLAAEASGVRVQTGRGVLTLTRLQAPGGQPLAARDFLNGHRLVPGDRLA